MTVEFAGQQLVLVMKQGNACRVKEHSQAIKANYLTSFRKSLYQNDKGRDPKGGMSEWQKD